MKRAAVVPLILGVALFVVGLALHRTRPVTKNDVLSAYEQPCDHCREDVNHDGRVNISDLGVVLGNAK